MQWGTIHRRSVVLLVSILFRQLSRPEDNILNFMIKNSENRFLDGLTEWLNIGRVTYALDRPRYSKCDESYAGLRTGHLVD